MAIRDSVTVSIAADERDPQADLAGQPGGRVDLAGDDVGLSRQQQHVVVREAQRGELLGDLHLPILGGVTGRLRRCAGKPTTRRHIGSPGSCPGRHPSRLPTSPGPRRSTIRRRSAGRTAGRRRCSAKKRASRSAPALSRCRTVAITVPSSRCACGPQKLPPAGRSVRIRSRVVESHDDSSPLVVHSDRLRPSGAIRIAVVRCPTDVIRSRRGCLWSTPNRLLRVAGASSSAMDCAARSRATSGRTSSSASAARRPASARVSAATPSTDPGLRRRRQRPLPPRRGRPGTPRSTRNQRDRDSASRRDRSGLPARSPRGTAPVLGGEVAHAESGRAWPPTPPRPAGRRGRGRRPAGRARPTRRPPASGGSAAADRPRPPRPSRQAGPRGEQRLVDDLDTVVAHGHQAPGGQPSEDARRRRHIRDQGRRRHPTTYDATVTVGREPEQDGPRRGLLALAQRLPRLLRD